MFSKQSALAGDYVHYFSQDPAIDQTSGELDHERWEETGDLKFLPLVNGGRLTKFILRRLTSSEKSILGDVAETHGTQQMGWWAVALALREINPLVMDGEPQDSTLGTTYDSRYKVKRLDDEWMDRLYDQDDAHSMFYEIARRVLQETFGSPRT